MSDHTTPVFSSLAIKLQELVNAGIVVLGPLPSFSDFPSDRVTVPVYDSNGTQWHYGRGISNCYNAQISYALPYMRNML